MNCRMASIRYSATSSSVVGKPSSSSVKLNPVPTGLSMYNMLWLAFQECRFGSKNVFSEFESHPTRYGPFSYSHNRNYITFFNLEIILDNLKFEMKNLPHTQQYFNASTTYVNRPVIMVIIIISN